MRLNFSVSLPACSIYPRAGIWRVGASPYYTCKVQFIFTSHAPSSKNCCCNGLVETCLPTEYFSAALFGTHLSSGTPASPSDLAPVPKPPPSVRCGWGARHVDRQRQQGRCEDTRSIWYSLALRVAQHTIKFTCPPSHSFDDPCGRSSAFVLFLKFLTSCLTPRSSMTSSLPPGIRIPGTSR